MAGTRTKRAKDVAQENCERGFRIDHAVIVHSDYEWLKSAERLVLWNVQMPEGFLARLKRLFWLDIRGGSGTNLNMVKATNGLRFLSVNQVRGMQDLSGLTELRELQALGLFGLPQVTVFPSLVGLTKLLRANVGSMRALTSMSGLLDAPNLRELLLAKKIGISESDVKMIANHRSLRAFDWFAEDVPNKVWVPVLERIKLPKVKQHSVSDWFRAQLGERPTSITSEEARALSEAVAGICAQPVTDTEKLEAVRRLMETRRRESGRG